MPGRGFRRRALRTLALFAAFVLTAGAIATPTSASPAMWSGVYRSDDFVVQSVMMSVSGSRVTLKSLQTYVRCTEVSTGQISPKAVWIVDYPQAAVLRANRFTFRFALQSNTLGPLVDYRITGALNPGGQGRVRVAMEGNEVDGDTGEVLSRCTGGVTFQVRRR